MYFGNAENDYLCGKTTDRDIGLLFIYFFNNIFYLLYYIKGKETLKNQGILAFSNAKMESENNILELKYADEESDGAAMELEYAILER